MDDNNFNNEGKNSVEGKESTEWHSPMKRSSQGVYYEKNKSKRRFISYFIVALIAALIGGLISSYIAPQYLYGNIIPVPKGNTGGENIDTNRITIEPQEDITTVSAVAEKAMDSVVGITTITTQQDFFGARVPSEGLGSGVIVNSNGYILTNSHVIGDGDVDRITVQFADGTKDEAEVLWNESALDLAVIKVNQSNLPAAELGDSDKLIVGEPAIAIGNPLGLQFQRTVTSGVISGLDRTISSEDVVMENLIQTDASINPGNSGGALLDREGKVIGINTAKITSAEGLGFSIPINIVKPIIEQIISDGEVNIAYIGVSGMDVTKYEKALGMNIDAEEGFIIIEIVAGSPAADAGIRANDILTKIGDTKVTSFNTLRKALYKYKPGDTEEITLIRNGETMQVDITFESASK
ncbi:trypsin-like peptidase domain-containing protein [Clostridium sp. D2Q-14]|uniref:serine protease HtrA n=1 Tax=Anaeromonas gelatinilytica TaxID=2683194 RepID=UPI00193C4415|nr:trypsin-like peptidase domain-containing protein [Anaeromonas gelatinilytica]MBS4534485.1 trypsin-like peptidase domain-containing protein [Anaeromonas gelatinilytica]